jgi:HEAT repeat protein
MVYAAARESWDEFAGAGAAALPVLLPLLEESGLADQGGAVRALGLAGDPGAAEPLIKALAASYPSVRSAAAEALGTIGDGRAVDPLVRRLADRVRDGREAAARALVAMYASGRLDADERARILAKRGTITHEHYDGHTDDPNCASFARHDDTGIGVEFPF